MKHSLAWFVGFVATLLLRGAGLAAQDPGCSSCGCPSGGAAVHGPGSHPDPALVALLGEGQDGRGCPMPSEVSPLGTGPANNLALIGARPFDLGSKLRGSSLPPSFGHDPMRGLVAGILADTPIMDRHGHGASFALGRSGTVATATGAFVQRVTFLELPADATHMGAQLFATYQSNTPTTGTLYQPFGPGWSLSGLDFLDGGTGTAPHASVTLTRGDGVSYAYTRIGTGNDYTSPVGSMDTLRWDGASKYVRTLADGRVLTYQVAVGSTTLYVREAVRGLYGTTIGYVFNGTQPLPELQSVTDTRGIKVVFTWTTQAGGARRITNIAYDPSSMAWSSLHPPVSTAAHEHEIELAYDAQARLSEVRWFPVWMVRDANGDQRIDLAGEQQNLRPVLGIEYGATHGKLERLRDLTYGSAPETRLKMTWQSVLGDWRVIQQIGSCQRF